MLPCFATGSRVYGEPRQDSDLDLVVLVDRFTLVLLQEMEPKVDVHEAETAKYGFDAESANLRFGKLNIIAVTDPKLFHAWFEGTLLCSHRADQLSNDFQFGKINRDEAIEILSAIRKKHGFEFLSPVEEPTDA